MASTPMKTIWVRWVRRWSDDDVQIMAVFWRTYVNYRTGETRTCVGCHEIAQRWIRNAKT